MFERFTDRARKVMALANQEAQRMNHEYVGTEHVLLGIIKEGSGVGATVLKNYNLNLEDLRKEVEKIVPVGPDMVTMGKLPQTPRVKQVIENAINYARELEHNYVGTEHLLHGLVSVKDEIGTKILRKHKLNKNKITDGIENLLGTVTVDAKLRLLIKNFGYRIEGGFVKTNSGLEIGYFKRDKRQNIPVVEYDTKNFNNKQINAALKYRDFLQKKDIKYKESLPCSKLAGKVRAQSNRLSSLADSLEKRV